MPSNFIILLGGPGKFVGCDKAHDQTWANYLVPIQLASMKGFFKLDADEKIHLLPYEPAYKNRWIDDSVITAAEKRQSDGYWLHSNRKAKTDQIVKKGATNYLHRIKQIADSQKMHFAPLTKPDGFWSYMHALPDRSISRVWYSGHASNRGLMLSIEHDTACDAVASVGDMLLVSHIRKHHALSSKISAAHKE